MKIRSSEVVMHRVMPFCQRVGLMLATGRWPVKGTYYEDGLHGEHVGTNELGGRYEYRRIDKRELGIGDGDSVLLSFMRRRRR